MLRAANHKHVLGMLSHVHRQKIQKSRNRNDFLSIGPVQLYLRSHQSLLWFSNGQTIVENYILKYLAQKTLPQPKCFILESKVTINLARNHFLMCL